MLSDAWQDYPVSLDPPQGRPPKRGFSEVVMIAGRNYCRAGDSGWYMLICWCAGPTNVLRIVDQVTSHTVKTTCRNPRTGEVTVATVPRSEEDQGGIESDINAYLADAGVPARPRGYTWYLHIPPGKSLSLLTRAVLTMESQVDAMSPRETAEAMQMAVDEFYQRS